jgi:IS30 family transposase
MKANWSQLAIADEIGVHPSTITRELARNRGQRGYRPKQAQEKAGAQTAPRQYAHHTSDLKTD